MANKYFANQNPTDISIQSEDGGGLVFTKQGKYLFGAKLSDINQQLNDEFYQGNVDIDPNTNSSYIAIMNEQSIPIGVDIPSTNQYSLFTPPESNIIEPNPPKDDCENEFNDASTILLNWENDNRNLGWAPYGANGTNIQDGELTKAQKYFYDNFWKSNNKNNTISTYGGSNINNPKLIIDNLPPGLRIMAAQNNYNSGHWFTRILVAAGEDFAKLKDSNGNPLGIPYRKSINIFNDPSDVIRDINTGKPTTQIIYNPTKNPPSGVETILWYDKRIELFINQYDDIIKYYESDKETFLTYLKDETKRFYKALVNVKNRPELDPFFDTYVNKAFELAKKYKDCPPPQVPSTTVVQNPNQSTQSSPLPSPTPPTSMTAEEVEEGIYEANFLPASEDQGYQLFDVEPMLDIDEVLILKNDVALGTEVKIINGKRVETATSTKNVGIVGKNAKEKIKNFFEKYSTDALNAVNGSYVFPEVKLAQAIKESGYGRHVINIGNYFGITRGSWTGDYGLYNTHEAGPNYKVNTSIGEVNYNEKDDKGWKYKRAFRHYKSVEEGFRDHTSILEKSYYKGYDEIGDPIGQGKHIGKVYATGPAYGEELAGIINELIPLFKGKYTVTKVGNKYKITVP